MIKRNYIANQISGDKPMIRCLSVLMFWTLLLIVPAQASEMKEVYYTKIFETEIPRKIPVLLRAYPVYQGNDIFRIYLLVETQYDFLQFIYDGNSYHAAIEFDISLKDHSSGEVKSRIFQSEFTETDFAATNRRDLYHFSLDSLDVSPGRYQVILKYRDQHGKERQQPIQFNIYLPEPEQFYASPILFTYPEKSMFKNSGIFASQPSALRNHWDFAQRLGIRVITWQAHPDTLTRLKLNILDPTQKVSIFSVDTTLSEASSIRSFYLHLSENLFKERKYSINISYRTPSDTIEHKLPLQVIWFDKPLSLWDIRTAVGPLEYLIEDGNKLDELKKGSDEERRIKFEAFWAQKDPTPDTPFNELQYEFYSRVDSANMKYSRKGLPGWRTDIGKVYILYGAPDEVVDNSLAPIKDPFLRWVYYQDDRKLSFTFLALDGRKRYKLAEVEEHPL